MKIKRNLSTLIIFFICLNPFSSLIAQGEWTDYTTSNTGSNNLSTNQIYEIAEDNLNNIWIGTAEGLSTFDGTAWFAHTPFSSMPTARIESIVIDQTDNVWVGNSTNSLGLSKFDGNTWTNFTTTDGLLSNNVRDVCEDNGIIWVATNIGISKYDGSTFSNFTVGDSVESIVFNWQTFQNDTTTVFQNYSISSVAVDQDHNLWVAAHYYGGSSPVGILRMFDGNLWTNYSISDGLIDTYINCITTDNQGNVWFGTSVGASKFDGAAWTNYTASDGLISNVIKDISIAPNGSTWFGTYNGVSKFDGAIWENFTINDGLVNNNVTFLFASQNGNIWCSTFYGISMYDGTVFNTISTKDGLINNGIISIDGNDRGVWFSTATGATFFDGNNWKSYTNADGLSGDYVLSVEEDSSGKIWCGISNNPVSILSTSSNTILGSESITAYDFVEDKDGNMWYGNYYGLHKFDGVTWTTFPINAVSSYGIKSLAADSVGNIWVGFMFDLIGKFDGSTWQMYTLGSGNINHHVNSIVFDSSGNVWSHGEGLYKFDGNTWQQFNGNNGFTNATIYGVAIDQSNYIWIATNNGVAKYDGNNFTFFHVSDGLIAEYIDNIGVDNFNNKWFGSYGKGLTKYCESMLLEGNVNYQGNSVLSGEVHLYRMGANEMLEAVSSTLIDVNGHYQFSVPSTGDYAISVVGDSTIYPNGIESFYTLDTADVNSIELIRLSCMDTLQFIDIELKTSSVVGIDNATESSSIVRIYPNPSSSHLTIDANFKIETILLTEASGKIVNHYSLTNNTIDISDLENGIYFISIIGAEKTITQKIVKQKI